jgi:RNA polymerase sigma-70 factor (ECF subfamily)
MWAKSVSAEAPIDTCRLIRLRLTMEDLSDEDLMLQYGAGDAEAFEILYRRHKDALYRFVRRQCRDPDIAYDLVHDIWIKLIKARRRYRPRARFTTYLFTLARNRMIDYYRSQAGSGLKTGREPSPIDVEDLPNAVDGGPERQAQIAEVLLASLDRLHSLPPVQREAILLYLEGLSMAEIAEITQVPQEAARSRVRRALAKLRAGLEDMAP